MDLREDWEGVSAPLVGAHPNPAVAAGVVPWRAKWAPLEGFVRQALLAVITRPSINGALVASVLFYVSIMAVCCSQPATRVPLAIAAALTPSPQSIPTRRQEPRGAMSSVAVSLALGAEA